MLKIHSTATTLLAAVLFATIGVAGIQADDPVLVDVVHLKNGGKLYGTVTEIVENKQKRLLVKTTDGAVLKLRPSQVARVRRPTNELREYLRLKGEMKDTVDEHWRMQEWCLENRRGLTPTGRQAHVPKEREYHLIRVIELDPDHRDARAILRYKDIKGVWVHEDHFYQNHGYIKDSRGIFRLPKAIEMRERLESGNDTVKSWNQRLKNLLTRIRKRNDNAAWAELTGITDPSAVPGLMKLMKSDDETLATKKVLVDIIGQIKSVNAQNALVEIATTFPDDSVGEQAVNLLKQPHYNRSGVVNSVIHWLRPSPKSSNEAVNRAAWIIGEMEETYAIRPLIDALVTVHLVSTGAGEGNMNAGFGNQGIGLNPGKKVQAVPLQFTNPQVLSTLRMLTGVNHIEYDERAWLRWYINDTSIGTNQLGRDR